jgi:hypothetical protein
LYIKRGKLLEKVKVNEETQKTAFVPAQNIGGHFVNGIKKTGFVSVSAKLKTEVSMVDTQIRDYKQVFGLEMFAIFSDLEDIEGWLPTVRDIRNIYDQCRRDVDELEKKRRAKEKELIDMGGTPMTQSSETSSRRFDEDDETGTPRFFREAAAAEAESDAHYRRTIMTTATTTSTNTATSTRPDPLFGSMGYGTGLPAQPTGYPDPLSALSGSNNNYVQPSNLATASTSYAAPVHTNNFLSDPFPTSSFHMNNGPNAMNTNTMDPFSDDGFGGTTMGGTANNGSAVASSNVDPFSAFDSLQPPTNTQQQQHSSSSSSSTINPMFRY